MNKLMGFLELKEMKLPSVPWKQYTGKENFEDRYLWTVRSAVYRGNDLNLPRSIGESSKVSKKFADQLLKEMNNNGIVIYYPYFIANKSGTLEVRSDKVIIEAVKDDLWNLVTYSEREVTIITDIDGNKSIIGNANFISNEELDSLSKHIPEIRKLFRNDLLQGKAALLEWSFAQSCNASKEPIGEKYLVFYEARTV
ncbi:MULTISPECIES: hypothetical protein [Lachnospiraceae]|jgi:hypothetical protein|uniref:hypothetical protein n=1 Tax=Lachnospiraceae TaxID=186803 RepID=UPI001FA9047E|nr:MULTISPECIES: hypothetical protein [Lachnospiraceae]